MKVKLKIVPNSSRSEVVGWLGDRLKIRIAATPEKGRANTALKQLVAAKLRVPIQTVHVVTGHTNALKTINIEGVSNDQLFAAGFSQNRVR